LIRRGHEKGTRVLIPRRTRADTSLQHCREENHTCRRYESIKTSIEMTTHPKMFKIRLIEFFQKTELNGEKSKGRPQNTHAYFKSRERA
jgi:hypothetical protein